MVNYSTIAFLTKFSRIWVIFRQRQTYSFVFVDLDEVSKIQILKLKRYRAVNWKELQGYEFFSKMSSLNIFHAKYQIYVQRHF